MSKVLLSLSKYIPIQCFFGLAFCSFIPSLFFWDYIFSIDSTPQKFITLIMSGALVVITIVTINRITRFPGIIATIYLLPITLFWFAVIVTCVKLFYLPYLLTYYCVSAFLLIIYLFILDMINRKYEEHVFAYIPLGRAFDMPEQVPNVKWLKLETMALDLEVTAIVADLHSRELSAEWEKFIAEKTLEGVPVYHHRNIRESLTGRVRIHHLYENELGSLLPSENYIFLKCCFDISIILVTLPITLVICFITGLLIKLEDGGKVFYVQPRIGYRGKVINVYKFRSMKEQSKEIVTVNNDNRITRVGRFIRKTRIDELPQFINVIKGEMSLIGPRAEFTNFAVELEKQVPFFNYRHIVKPGISGWAQVNQGYATGPEETQIKIEYDFYYIKHFSFSLDLLIFFKTIYTMLTGYGAR